MLVWLDTTGSKKGNPNENYARELMELFSLGIGNYTEKDIREAARAFTGWEVDRNGQCVRSTPSQHDDGDEDRPRPERQLEGRGHRPHLPRAEGVPVLHRPQAVPLPGQRDARADRPSCSDPLAEQFRKSDYDFGALVATMLRSNLFFAPQAYRTRIKSPGRVRARASSAAWKATARGDGRWPATRSEKLGQHVFFPPSVKGWDGGPAWLNGQTLLVRQNLALALTLDTGRPLRRPRRPCRPCWP